MNPRIRKLVATLLIVLLVALYAIVSTAVAVAQLAESGPLVHLAYFFFSGILWIIPAMFLISWAEGKPKA